jgi:hypothetical protein
MGRGALLAPSAVFSHRIRAQQLHELERARAGHIDVQQDRFRARAARQFDSEIYVRSGRIAPAAVLDHDVRHRGELHTTRLAAPCAEAHSGALGVGA